MHSNCLFYFRAPPAPPCVSLTQISTSNFAPAKATESLLMLEIDALKKKLDNLTDENKKLKVQVGQCEEM